MQTNFLTYVCRNNNTKTNICNKLVSCKNLKASKLSNIPKMINFNPNKLRELERQYQALQKHTPKYIPFKHKNSE